MFSIDYFSIDALSRLFLHYWSLSIEEQFYLISPFIFALCVNRMWILVFIIATSALLFSLLDENLAFYLTFSRIFGLLTGVLLAFSEFKRTKTYIIPNICSFLFVWSIPYLQRRVRDEPYYRPFYSVLNSCSGTVNLAT
jgi:peptidoglycan/LPS O-acetylase OafA/YrhL